MRDARRAPRFAHSARVATIAALLVALLYVGVTLPFDVLDARHLIAQVDARLAHRLHYVTEFGPPGAAAYDRLPVDDDVDTAPVVFWRAKGRGYAVALDGDSILSFGAWSRSGRPTDATVGSGDFRLIAARVQAGWLVAGESLAEAEDEEAVVGRAEVVVGPMLVVAMFFGALGIGLMASRPVDQARRRQLEFSADASHELRTPVAVIEAETSLALTSPRDGASYRTTLARIGTEGNRLRQIVEDLLFLAQFDAKPPTPGDEPVDLVTLAGTCVLRFAAVAEAKTIGLSAVSEGPGTIFIGAPPALVDRLCGVLLDNACRYAGAGGSVRVLVSAKGHLASLAVEDSGLGIPVEERPCLFDRFRRGTDGGEGTGLGLAIADAVVRSTGGKWRVADAPAGGARIEVLWRRLSESDSCFGPPRRRRPSAAMTGSLTPLPRSANWPLSFRRVVSQPL
jgi:signal transduction histidine kinase